MTRKNSYLHVLFYYSVLHQYLNLVEPAFEEFWLPTKKYTDIIVPRRRPQLILSQMKLVASVIVLRRLVGYINFDFF
uniref:Uncharacterized protein n=1 Tax=Wuchereria bancrofti TaxID=6293 RepID=A0A1I8EQC9_WUCBA